MKKNQFIKAINEAISVIETRKRVTACFAMSTAFEDNKIDKIIADYIIKDCISIFSYQVDEWLKLDIVKNKILRNYVKYNNKLNKACKLR